MPWSGKYPEFHVRQLNALRGAAEELRDLLEHSSEKVRSCWREHPHLVIGPLVHANSKKLSRTSHMQGNLHVWFWPGFPEIFGFDQFQVKMEVDGVGKAREDGLDREESLGVHSLLHFCLGSRDSQSLFLVEKNSA
ncbi:hypothetical protein Nepgr_004113 [Nepenthes gracilis]|uniref:Uncharacterized protein n=1 Tax=Nepenthes gracilis TaxID=150966 RepID=A0AAD3S0W3_NEPGR|nr:hypothetical protein Nepgr_004113 [Nepenthes gracilis]